MQGFEGFLRRNRGVTSTIPGMSRRFRIGWRAYFDSFCEVHGRFYFQHKGRFLFPDGWTYSATDERGPEWPPPEDRAARLMLIRDYWRLRWRWVHDQLLIRRRALESLEEMTKGRSLPLQQQMISFEDGPDGGRRPVIDHRPIDLKEIKKDLEDMEADLNASRAEVRACTLELRLIRMEVKSNGQEPTPVTDGKANRPAKTA